MDSWSQSYLQGAADAQLGKLKQDIITSYAYYMQSNCIATHPSVDIVEEYILDDETIFSHHDGYFRGAIETANNRTLNLIKTIFDDAVTLAMEDYDDEAKRYDEWYQRPEDLPYAFINDFKIVEVRNFFY